MIINKEMIQFLKKTPNDDYELLKSEFIYNTNKIEGSSFSYDEIIEIMEYSMIKGEHRIDDVLETINSLEVLNYIIDTLDEPLSKNFILDCHRLLKDKTGMMILDYVECRRRFLIKLYGVDTVLAQPWEAEYKIEKLLRNWEAFQKEIEDILLSHLNFETIHPFQDGNGRIGRFIMLKQCIENYRDLILIYDRYSKKYKESLYIAQSKKDLTYLNNVISKCIDYSHENLEFLLRQIDYINKTHH